MEQGMVLTNVCCELLSNTGVGVVKEGKKKIFIPNFLPGEMADVIITKKTSKYIQAEIIQLKKESPERVQPICPQFGICGGCELQHCSETLQLETKRRHAVQTLQYQLGESSAQFGEIVASPKTYNYRNKIFFSLYKQGGVFKPALYKKNSQLQVAIDQCFLVDDTVNDTMHAVAQLAELHHVEVFNRKENTGDLKRVCIRQASTDGAQMVIFILKNKKQLDTFRAIANELYNLPQIKSVYINTQPENTSELMGTKDKLLVGEAFLEEQIMGNKILIGPQTFFQINHQQTEQLYKQALSYVTSTETILDFYSGVGTIALAASEYAHKVIAVEINDASVTSAKQNAAINQIENVTFVAEDASSYIAKYIESQTEEATTVIVDPPRGGLTKEFIADIKQLAPEKIIYISCNPQTLAQDLADLTRENAYATGPITFFEMFPQTMHVESVVLLSRVEKK